jgi:hypothetical protein
MKVYLVFSVHEFEGEHYKGAYASRELAEYARIKFEYEDSYCDYNIYEEDVKEDV